MLFSSSVTVAVVALSYTDVALARAAEKPTPTYAKTWAGVATADSFPPAGTTGGTDPLFPNYSVVGYPGPTPSMSDLLTPTS